MAPPLLALCAVLAAAASAGNVPDTPFTRALESARAAARTSYATHTAGTPVLRVSLPIAGPNDNAGDLELLRAVVEQAADVQEGCTPQCTAPSDIAVYGAKIDLVAQRLGFAQTDLPRLHALYMPGGVPRRKNGPSRSGDAARALDAEVTAKLLTMAVPPDVRTGLQRRALAIADALGRTPELRADADGVVTFADGSRARVTPAQLAELIAMPRAQAQVMRSMAALTAPPSPVSRQEQILAEADRAVEEGGGTIADTYKFWQNEENNPNNGRVWRAYAWFNQALLTGSGLPSVEASAGRLGYVWNNEEVSSGQKWWMGTKLAGNMALSLATFLPAASFAKSLQAGEGFYWIGRGGTAVTGMAAASVEATAAMRSASASILNVVRTSLPTGAEVTVPRLRILFTNLNRMASRYGVVIEEGGTAAQSTSEAGRILVSLKAGAPHEALHAVQQVYTNVLALEQVAARAGTTVEALTAVQRAEAFAQVARWEAASYAQMEAQAFRATGFGGSGAGAGYRGQLALAGREITTGMVDGTVINGTFGTGASFYGRLTQWVGHTQFQIGVNVASPFATTVHSDSIANGWMPMIDGAVAPMTQPTLLTSGSDNAIRLLQRTAGPARIVLPGSR